MKILAVFWRELTIAGLLLFMVLANKFYVNTIKLERDMAELQAEIMKERLDNQSAQILKESEKTRREVLEGLSLLDTRLAEMNRDQKALIEDLLKLEIPVECGEDFNRFLIDMVDQLRWSSDG